MRSENLALELRYHSNQSDFDGFLGFVSLITSPRNGQINPYAITCRPIKPPYKGMETPFLQGS
jgi:hypothetical protein